MRKKICSVLALFFLILFTAVQLSAGAAFTGAISDGMCGFKHMIKGMSGEDCVGSCVKGGSKYVLADRERQKLYALDDQIIVKPFAGHNVVIRGALAKDGKTIHVVSVKAASTKSK